jgi:mannose-6-phosphate isomerase-like protein (cupin superfamily)
MTELNGADRTYVLDRMVRITVLTAGAETEGRFDVVMGIDQPHSATALHLHTRYEERFCVLDGELTVWAGADRVTLGPGGYATVPRNVPHMIQTGPHGAHALVISSPAGFAELIERTGTPARLAGPDVELDLELFMRVSTELGDVVLGPPGTTPDQVDVADPPIGGPHPIHAVPGRSDA